MDEKKVIQQTLQDVLAAALPQGFSCKAHHVHTAPKPCDALFPSAPGRTPEKTRSANHFLTVSILADKPNQVSTSSNLRDERRRQDVLVLGLEVFVYTTKHLTTIFVGKADSTGYLMTSAKQSYSPIKAICTAFLQWLSNQMQQKYPDRTLVISLFARAQAQYLFPGSSEHAAKHVLDDHQLVKWWAKVLNPIITAKAADSSSTQGYLTIPGYSAHELRAYLPPGASKSTHWKTGNPLKELGVVRGELPDAPPRCLLPRFPDDPKARFMSDLDDEVGISDDTSVTASPVKNKTGKWKNIATIDRFWEAMEFRQECASGRVVGFLWVVMSPRVEDDGQVPSASQQTAFSENSDARAVTPTPAPKSSPRKRRRTPLTGPIIPRQPRLKGGSSALADIDSSKLDGINPARANSGVSLAKSAYAKTMHTLLHLDFCDLDVATLSTTKWISEVSHLSGVAVWALDIVGTLGPAARPAADESSNAGAHVLDMSNMVRKKRKAVESEEKDAAADRPAVNVLGAGMVRKKAKKPVDL
nr:histone acetyltransferase [Quercus suber]